jgi:hypothetical protein
MFTATSSRLTQLLRSVVTPTVRNEVTFSSSAALNAQFWLGHFLWRPTAVWGVLAALLANGLLIEPALINWQTFVLVVLLVDPLWGSIWRLAAGRKALLPLDAHALAYQLWMPYLQPRSPAQKLLGWDSTGVLPLLFRIALPSVILAGGVALVLGRAAIAMTVLVILASVLGWTLRRSLRFSPILLESIVAIALPWLLTAHQLAGTVFTEPWVTPQLLLVGFLTLHHWGEGRLLRNGQDWFAAGLLAFAEVCIVMLLIVAQTPLWLAVLAIFWLPGWVALVQGQPLARANFWWLLALLACALAVRMSA